MKYLLFLIFFISNLTAAAISYKPVGSRFGDNLLNYLHAKWLSHHYHMPLLYRPFLYSTLLKMDDLETPFDRAVNRYKKILYISKKKPRPFTSDNIFVCTYFPEVPWEIKSGNYFSFPVGWKDARFRAQALEMIAPKKALNLIYPPEGITSIALHFREGGGYDDANLKYVFPLKAPPLAFYIESLKTVMGLCPGKELYCHVFTDADNPQIWVDKLAAAMNDAPITFNYRTTNSHNLNVLEDFFSFFNFDILIRPESNFSIIPSLLHDFAILCHPESFVKVGSQIIIDEIHVDVNQDLLNSLYNL